LKRKNEIRVILGKKGFGKTSYVIAETDELKRLVIFDYNREYTKGKIISTPFELIQQLRLNQDGFFRLIYRPSDEFSIQQHFEFFSEIVYEIPNSYVVMEEIDLVSTAGFMPEGLQKIINYGRHKAINLFAISRRAHKVPRDLTANADVIVTFNQQEPRDIKYLCDYMGEVGEKVRELKKGETESEFLEFSIEGFQVRKINFLTKKIS